MPEILRRGVESNRHRPDVRPPDPLSYLPEASTSVTGPTMPRKTRRVHRPCSEIHRAPRRGDGRLMDRGAEVFDLRQLVPVRPTGGYARLRYPGFCGVHPSAFVKERDFAGRPCGDPADIAATDQPCSDLFPERSSSSLITKAQDACLPGTAGAHLLAGLRRTRPAGVAFQRTRGLGCGEGTLRHWTRSLEVFVVLPTARPSPCSMVRTPCGLATPHALVNRLGRPWCPSIRGGVGIGRFHSRGQVRRRRPALAARSSEC